MRIIITTIMGIFLLTSIASAQTWTGNYHRYATVGVVPLKARIYLWHGLDSTSADFTMEPFATWIADLQTHGFEIITPDMPFADPNFFKGSLDSGLAYANAFKVFLQTFVSQINSAYGNVPMNITGGVSWGGLHALMSQELLPGIFDAYFASMPVTELVVLDEFTHSCDGHEFSPFNHPEILASKPGYIQWGDEDTRVDYHTTEVLWHQIQYQGGNILANEWNGYGHVSTPAILQAITNWLGNL